MSSELVGDRWALEAFAKSAKQINAEFDCLSDRALTRKQTEQQIVKIIWQHFDKARRSYPKK